MKYFILLLIICIACAFVRYENFEINDYYSRYLNDISVPPDFYFQGAVAQELPTIEFNDRFFLDALKASVYKDILKSETETDKVPLKGDEVKGLNTYLEKILNSQLPSSENTLFAAIYGEILDYKQYVSNNRSFKSQHIVYRDGRVYGISITITTLVTPSTVLLADYKLNGFVMSDRLNLQQPYNLDQNENHYFMQDKTIIKDPKYVKDYLCQYYSDVEKYKGIKVNTHLDC